MIGTVLLDAVVAVVVDADRGTDAAGNVRLDIPAASWRTTAEAVAATSGQLDWLTGVDLGSAARAGAGEIEVVAMFLRDDESLLVRTRVEYGEPLPTVGDLFASAGWHERETAEMLGVTFTGGDPRRLLLPESEAGYPLRRDFRLTARLDTPWPGAEPGRRARVPGINPEWQR